MIELLCERFEIGGAVRDAALRAQARCETIAYPAQREVKANVMRAFLDEGLSESDLAGSTGYGYDDAARSGYESLLARIFGVERALARLSIVSGTHAIVTTLAACVPPGSTLLSISGRPYDTLRNAICDAPHSLVRQGVAYREIDAYAGRRYRPRRARCGPRAAGSRGRFSATLPRLRAAAGALDRRLLRPHSSASAGTRPASQFSSTTATASWWRRASRRTWAPIWSWVR